MHVSSFIEAIEQRQGLKVAWIEEIAYLMGYIDAGQVERLADPLTKKGSQLPLSEGYTCRTITQCGGEIMRILANRTTGQVGWELARQGPEYGFDTSALN